MHAGCGFLRRQHACAHGCAEQGGTPAAAGSSSSAAPVRGCPLGVDRKRAPRIRTRRLLVRFRFADNEGVSVQEGAVQRRNGLASRGCAAHDVHRGEVAVVGARALVRAAGPAGAGGEGGPREKVRKRLFRQGGETRGRNAMQAKGRSWVLCGWPYPNGAKSARSASSDTVDGPPEVPIHTKSRVVVAGGSGSSGGLPSASAGVPAMPAAAVPAAPAAAEAEAAVAGVVPPWWRDPDAAAGRSGASAAAAFAPAETAPAAAAASPRRGGGT